MKRRKLCFVKNVIGEGKKTIRVRRCGLRLSANLPVTQRRRNEVNTCGDLSKLPVSFSVGNSAKDNGTRSADRNFKRDTQAETNRMLSIKSLTLNIVL